MQELAGLLAKSPPRVSMRAVILLQHMCLLPSDPDFSGSMMVFDKAVCASLLKNRAVADPLATFAIANSVKEPVSDMEWVGSQALRAFVFMLDVTEGFSADILPKSEPGR